MQVESLTSARKAAVSGSEPADAVRAVNALLTALDSLKNFPNVMLLTTSNITEAIDVAFLDRADIKAYLGPPELQACHFLKGRNQQASLKCHDSRLSALSCQACVQPADTFFVWDLTSACRGNGSLASLLAHALLTGRIIEVKFLYCEISKYSSLQARYEILRSCLAELQRVSIISPSCCPPPPFQDLRPTFVASSGTDSQARVIATENGFGATQMAGEQLRQVAEACEVFAVYLIQESSAAIIQEEQVKFMQTQEK